MSAQLVAMSWLVYKQLFLSTNATYIDEINICQVA